MVEHQPSRAHRAEQPLAVQRQIGMADVLEHADTDRLVEAAILGQVAIVHQLQRHPVLQALGGDPLTGQRELFAAQGDAEHLGAELAGGEACQPAPAAADIEQAVAGLEPQLAAEQAQLGLLRLVEILLAGFEIGTGVDHVPVQPEPVEIVGQVVVVGDRLGIGGLVMRLASRQGEIVLAQRAAHLVADADDLFERSQQVYLPLDIGGTEQIQAGMCQLRDQVGIPDNQGDAWGRPEVDLLAIPQPQLQRQGEFLKGR